MAEHHKLLDGNGFLPHQTCRKRLSDSESTPLLSAQSF